MPKSTQPQITDPKIFHPKGVEVASSVVTLREATGDKSITLDRHEKKIVFSLIAEETIVRRANKDTENEDREKSFMIWDEAEQQFREGRLAVTFPKAKGKELRVYFKKNAARAKEGDQSLPFYPEAGDRVFVMSVEGDRRPYIGAMSGYVFDGVTSDELEQKSYVKGAMIDVQDVDYQQQVHAPTLPSGSKLKVSLDHGRSAAIGKKAIRLAGFQCQHDPEHLTFKSGSDGHYYMEPHHLVPISTQSLFPNASLDCLANIIVLCPTCHRAIHYGDVSTKSEMVKKFFDERKDDLFASGIEESLEGLLEKYGVK